MKLYVNGKEAAEGMQVRTFRGANAILINWYEPGTASGGKGGKVYIRDEDGHEGIYFPAVIGGKFIDESKEELTCQA